MFLYYKIIICYFQLVSQTLINITKKIIMENTVFIKNTELRFSLYNSLLTKF